MSKMIKVMTQPERTKDICERCNLSKDIVEAVLAAQNASERDSLKRGERVVRYGSTSLTPVIVSKIGKMGRQVEEVKVECRVSPNLSDFLNEIENYKIATEDIDSLVVKTLPFLE